MGSQNGHSKHNGKPSGSLDGSAHSTDPGEHHGGHPLASSPLASSPLGMSDVVAGAILLVVLASLIKLILDAFLPGMFPLATFVQTLISGFVFLAIWALLGNSLFKPYLDVVEQRETATVGAEQLALELRREMQQLSEEIEEQLRIARVEGIKRRDAQVEDAKRKANTILERVASQAGERLKSAQEQIASLHGQAQREVEVEAEKLAQLVCQRALETTANPTVH